MRNYLTRALALLCWLLLAAAPVVAQTFPTVPSQTVLGRTAFGTGPAQAIPFSTITANLCNAFTTTTKGCVPAPATATGRYLGDDGAWHAQPTQQVVAGTGVTLGGTCSGSVLNCTVNVNATAAVTSIAGNTGAFTLNKGITNATNAIGRALNEATLLGTPSNPAATTSTVGVMMGLGSTCAITPVYSTRLRLTFDGIVGNNVSGNGTTLQVRYGTGTAPSNGVAAAGNPVGSSLVYGNGTSVSNVPFSKTVIITGLSAGVAVWLDLVLVVSANTGTLTGITCSAMEF